MHDVGREAKDWAAYIEVQASATTTANNNATAVRREACGDMAHV